MMDQPPPAFKDDGRDSHLLHPEVRECFQQIFADQAVRAYLYLSLGIGLLALSLPFALLAAGGYHGHFSLSSFYHASDLTRNILVGALWATGVFLFLFHGLSQWENWLLNVAGVAAILIAMIPGLPTQDCKGGITLHTACAIAFFICLATVAIGFSKRRVRHITDATVRKRFKRAYDLAGTLMIAMPATIAASHFLGGARCASHWIFWVETAGILAFALYWFTKTVEYKLLLRISWVGPGQPGDVS